MLKKVLCVIPARMGSVRIPHKNLSEIALGKTLIDQAIECCGNYDYVISTDQPNILNSYPPRNIVERPLDLSGPFADISDAVSHALNFVDPLANIYDIVVTLQPAVVARSFSIVNHMLKVFSESSARGAITVVKTHPWIWSVRNGSAANNWYPKAYPRSQDSDSYFIEINSVQITLADIARNSVRWDLPLLLYELPEWATTLDIDTPEDLEEAKHVYSWASPFLSSWYGKHTLINEINGLPYKSKNSF